MRLDLKGENSSKAIGRHWQGNFTKAFSQINTRRLNFVMLNNVIFGLIVNFTNNDTKTRMINAICILKLKRHYPTKPPLIKLIP